MKTRNIIATLLLSTLVAVGFGVDSAHAGIVVTVGKPKPDLCPQESVKRKAVQQRRATYESDGTRCVELPTGGVECGQSIRVGSLSAVPTDWRCVSVSSSILYCELPTMASLSQGAGPGAGGPGELDPSRLDNSSDPAANPQLDTLANDGELMAMGCSAGGSSTLLGILAALGLLGVYTRRRKLA